MFSIAELMDTSFLPERRYTLRISEPNGTLAYETSPSPAIDERTES